MKKTVLDMKVKNHPGVMSHITGLFARRGFNLDGILCAPGQDSNVSRLILFAEHSDLSQVQKQLEKLHDVISLEMRCGDYDSLLEQIQVIA